MIPILYESTETLFANNGLGRLRDCISCVVTEERNGIYECDFDYPVGGQNYDDIQLGRIVVVEHDDTGDIQPFDIVSVSRPINGVVTFHCVHVSYRLRGMTVWGSSINTLAAALAKLGDAVPASVFSYWTDKTSTGYCAAFDGIPKTVRSILGGVEGSILDAYGVSMNGISSPSSCGKSVESVGASPSVTVSTWLTTPMKPIIPKPSRR